MLKTTRFTLWSYRWALPGMALVLLFVTYCNILGGSGERDVVSYASGMISTYLVLIPFMISMMSINNTVHFALTMGQPRRAFSLELPLLNLSFTLLLDILCFGGGLVVIRLMAGRWVLSFAGLAVCMLALGWALGAAGQLVGLLGMRFGWKGWLGGFIGLALLYGGGGSLLMIFLGGRRLAALLEISAAAVSLKGALVLLGAAAVMCAVFHAVSWLLLRRYVVK